MSADQQRDTDRVKALAITFGAELRSRRQAVGLQQRDLADRIGYDRSYVSQVESGRQIPAAQFAVLCERELATGGVLLGMFQGLLAERESQRQAQHVERWCAKTAGGVEVAQLGARASDEGMDRRQLLIGTAAFAAAVTADRIMGASLQGNRLGWEQATATLLDEQAIIVAVRRALLRHDGSAHTPASPDLDGLRRRVRDAWRLRQEARYRNLGAQLPSLIIDARSAADQLEGDERRAALKVLTHTYNVTSSVLKKLGDSGLAVIAADRAVQAARTTGEPLLVAAGAYRLANVFLPAGRNVEAREVAEDAATGLEPYVDASPVQLATWGGLMLTAAAAAAADGKASEAWELVGVAKMAARRLEVEHADLHTIFGPTTLAIQSVQVAAELEDGHETIRRAQLVDADRLPRHLLERRSHFLIDLARGHGARNQDGEAVAALLDAERLAPEEVRYNPLAHDLIRTMLRRERRSATPELRGLSGRVAMQL